METKVVGEPDYNKCPLCHKGYDELDQWFDEKTRKINSTLRFICGKCVEKRFEVPNEN